MDMKLDRAKLKVLRESKAWSQSHLAEVSGISLRTIQRIEKTGVASPESVKSICATFDIKISELLQNEESETAVDPSFAALMKFKVSSMDKKATLIAFVIAFTIAFLLTV